MFAKTRRCAATLVMAAGIVAWGALPALGQTATDTTGIGGSTTASSTGPNAPLTLGTSATGSFGAGSGGGVSDFDEEPLPETGGGDVAIAAGGMLMAGGLGLRWAISRRRAR